MIEKYNYEGRENIGFHAVVTDKYVLVPQGFRKSSFFDLKEIETKIAKTDLVGLFAAGNSNKTLLPRETTEYEKEAFEEAEVSFKVLESRYNALGNLILCNDSGAVISPRLEDFKTEIEEALQVEAVVGQLGGLNPGVSAVANSKGAVIHREASEEEAKKVKDALNLEEVDIGTVNQGSPYVGSGAVANDSDMLTGENTTGPEIGRFDRTLF